MKKPKQSQWTKITFLLTIILAGGFLRFYKLDWGDGNYFHPDEYHLVISANQIVFPNQMHPHLFSYGSTTVYLMYFTKLLIQTLFNYKVGLFLVGRFFSASFSTLSLPIIYLIAKDVFNKSNCALLTTLVSALTPGIIQQAHFATPESAITFWMLLSLYFTIKYLKKPKPKTAACAGVSIGLAAATKITSTLTLPGPITIFFYKFLQEKKLKNFLLITIIFLLSASAFFFLAFPYSILDSQGLKSSMNYETAVGMGRQKVFYTRSFENTIPIVFQFRKILIHAIDPVNLILGTLGFFSMIYLLIKNHKKEIRAVYFLVIFFFSSYFLFNSFLYAKWTRFIAPTFSYFAIFSTFLISNLQRVNKKAGQVLIGLSLVSAVIWSFSFFSIYTKDDVRTQATTWIQTDIPKGSYILTETGNIAEVPLKGNYPKLAFDFYHLDQDPTLQYQLLEELEKSEYFIIQSRRMFMDHSRNNFPLTYNFYNQLTSGFLGFKKINEFTSFPTIPLTSITINDESAEETWSVFDHPVIRIYKKTLPLNVNDYKEILKI